MTSRSWGYIIISPKNENARDFSREEEGVMAAMGSLKAFQTQILKKLDNHSGQKLKYEQF